MKKITFAIFLLLIIGFTSGAQTLSWVKQFKTPNEAVRSMAVDLFGNVYAAGNLSGIVDFDPGAETYNLGSAGTNDFYIWKLNSTGDFLWAKQLVGKIGVNVNIAVDASGNVYLLGEFNGTIDFNPGSETFELSSPGSTDYDVFISKLDASGNFLWAKQLVGTVNDYGEAIAVDASGNVYTTGVFNGTTDFDPGSATFNLSAASSDIFISKLDGSGNFLWAKQMGGTSIDAGSSIAIDAAGNVYTTGTFNGTADFDPESSTFPLISAGFTDVFISKLNSAGSFIWAKRIGGPTYDNVETIVADASSNIYISGSFDGTSDFDPSGSGVLSLTASEYMDVFICKLNAAGDLKWAKKQGGADYDYAIMTVDAFGNVFTAGTFVEPINLDPDGISFPISSIGASDIYISIRNEYGNFVWSQQIGEASEEEIYAINSDSVGNVYLSGKFTNTIDFDPGNGTVNLTSSGDADVFIYKIHLCPPSLAVIAPGDVTFCGNTVKLTGATVNNNLPYLWKYVSGAAVSIQPSVNAHEPIIVFPSATAGSVTLHLKTPECDDFDEITINQTNSGLPTASIVQKTLTTAATSNINFNPSINGIVNWNVSGTGSVATSAPYNYQPSAQDILDGAVEIVANVQGTGACSAYFASDTIRITLASANELYSMSGSITNAALTTQSTLQIFKKLNAYWVMLKDTMVNNSSYVIPNLTNGEYKIVAYTSDIERIDTYYGNVTRWADATTITMSNGNVTGLNINLQQYSISAADLLEYLNGSNRVAGRVTLNTSGNINNLKTQADPSNIKPVENANVILYDNSGTTKLISSQTNDNGFYIIDGMQPSQVQIEAEYPGTVLEGTTVTNPDQTQEFVIVEGADNVKNIQLVKIDDASLNKLSAAQKGIDLSETTRLLFPNPATSVVYIRLPEAMKKSGNYKLIVFNSAGVPVETSNYDPAADVLKVDISGLNKGIYYLYLTSGAESVKEKLVVE